MILLWAVASGQLVQVLRCTSDVKHSTVSVAFNQDTTLLASCISGHTKGNRGTIEIWEVASGRLCQVLVRAGYIRSVTFSPNGIFLASNIEETVQLWEMASGQLVHVLQGGGRFRCLQPRWDPPGQRRSPWECPALVGWTGYVNRHISFSPWR